MDFQTVRDWLLDPTVLLTVTGGTLALAAASLAAVPFMVIRLPRDHFVRPRPRLGERLRAASAPGKLLLLLKNLLGLILGLLGVLMLVLPGQGLLTILLALVLLDLPRKHALERRLVRRPGVRRALDGLRRRFGRPPFEHPPTPGDPPPDTSDDSPPVPERD